MDGDNLTTALMIGVTTFISIIVISAIIMFYTSSLNLVKSAGTGVDYSTVYRSDIESTLLMSNTGNYIKGTSVKNLLSYYEQDTDVSIFLQNIKYIDSNGDISTYGTISITTDDESVRKTAYNLAMKYLMDNQDFTIVVDYIDESIGSKNITIKGV